MRAQSHAPMLRILFLGLALLGPLAATADSAGKVYRLGYLTPRPLPDASANEFMEGMRKLGYVDGRNIVIEMRSANLKFDNLQRLAAELVERKVDVIVAATGTAALAAKRATSRVPIVVAASNDAVAMGIVGSLQRPGGNVTGVTGLSAQLAPKRLEALKELLPTLKRIAVLWCPRAPINRLELGHVRTAAKALAIATEPVAYDEKPETWRHTMEDALQRHQPDAFFMLDCTSLPFQATADFALERRVPLISPYSNVVRMGGLVSYGADWGDLYRRVAPAMVDKVLKGAKPGDVPFEQPTKFELVLNLRTAKALNLTVPASFLLRVNSAIE